MPVGSGKKQLTAEQKAKKASQSRAYRERVKAAKDALMRAIPAQPKWPISDDVVRYQGLRYPAQLEREYETWVKSLTPEEYNAVSYYTSSGYVPINEFLRTGKATGAYTAHEVKTRVDAIESALFKARDSVKPELVWRGLPDKKGMEFVDSVAFGDVITMKGFQSTSISPGFAHSWSPGTRSALFEIKPTRGAYIRQISDHQEELEFLLPHDAKYRVVGKTRVKIQRHGEIFERPVIQLEMLQ